MPRTRAKLKVSCPNCGRTPRSPEELKKYVVKERVLTSVGFSGKVTVTVMGIVECPVCGKRFRTVLAKKKLEPSGKSPKERVIAYIKERRRVAISELSRATGFSERALRLALEGYVKDGIIKGHFEGDVFVLDARRATSPSRPS